MPLSLCHVWLFATQWTTTHQVPLFMGFSWEEYRSSFLFSSLGIFLVQGSNLSLLRLLHCGWILYHLNQWEAPVLKINPQFLKNFSLQEMELYSFSLEWTMQKWCYFISDVRLQKGCSFHLRYKKIFHLVHALREFNSYIVRLLRQLGEPYMVGNWNFQLTANKELKFANEKGRGLRNGSHLHIPRQA